MVPVLELRGSLIYSAACDLHPLFAYLICVIGNLLPVPIIILFVRPVFEWMKKKNKFLNNIVEKLEKKADSKSDVIQKYEMLGLFILVAIPLPGTGAWTGSLVAAMLNMRLKAAFHMIALGVAVAGIVMTILSYGVGMFFG